jgi:hypothetical protein
MRSLRCFLSFGLLAALSPADDGMWLFNQFPRDQVRKKYGFNVSDDFLRHLQLSSVRVGNGGSGSFVSPNGLLFTNHHVAAGCIFEVSSSENNYIRDGFYASEFAGEKHCPGMEAVVLLEMEDVTAKVTQGIPAGMPSAEANEKRKAAIAGIEKTCTDSTDRRCDVVTLYSGALYHLYKYKKYTDIRLVFAPEEAIAAFGGDPDNFTYPRYCYDLAFLRAYEDGKPIRSEHYLKWSTQGAQDKELTFVTGHPGSTGRLLTLAELEFERGMSLPKGLAQLKRLEAALLEYGRKGEEQQRQTRDLLVSYQNSIKARSGFLDGLNDSRLLNRKRADEKKLRAAIAANPAKFGGFAAAWDNIATAMQEFRKFYSAYALLESRGVLGSDLYAHARHLVRYAAEKTKPNEKRLREYTEAALPSTLRPLKSAAPIYPGLEIAMVAANLRLMLEEFGPADPTVSAVLEGRTPEEAAAEFVQTTKLTDKAERERLLNDDAAIASAGDGMIRLARLLDAPSREVRKRYEDNVSAVLTDNSGKVARARFAAYGTAEYPDATFTLRLTFGHIQGYENAQGKWIPWATDFGGVYKRATGEDPFKLPGSWLKSRDSINLRTPFNFVTTCDTHGGNSGSPTVNVKGEIIGILFDGNIEGLPNRYVFTDEQARSVHVAAQGIIEGLRKVYRTGPLLRELGFTD